MPELPGPGPIDAVIGARIRHARQSRRVSQVALGACIGVQYQSVQDYEAGRRRITATALLLTARALDTPVTYFYADLDGPFGVTPAPLAAGHG